MKLVRAFAVAALGLLFALPAAAQQKSRLETIQQTGKLRVGTTGDFNPMSFRDPATKEYRGHQIDAANQLAKDLGVQVEFVPTEWATLVNGVVTNRFDIVMTGTSMSVARAKVIGFTIPWGRNAFVPLVLKTNAGKFKEWDDLNKPSVTVGFNLGTTMEQFVQNDLPKATVRRVESPARDWQELLSGRVDATIASLIEAAALTQEYPQLTTALTDKPRNGIPMAFVAPIDDPIWLGFLNNWITIKRAAGYFDEINAKWKIVSQN